MAIQETSVVHPSPVDFNDTRGTKLSEGTTAQRTNEERTLRLNSDTGMLEYFYKGVVHEVGAGGGGGNIARWELVNVAGTLNMVAGTGYLVDSDALAAQLVLVMPATDLTNGDAVAIRDLTGKAATKTITISRGTGTIDGLQRDQRLTTNFGGRVFEYYSETPGSGWFTAGGGNQAGATELRGILTGTGLSTMAWGWYPIDTSGIVSVRVPEDPQAGDIVEFTDVVGNAEANNVSVLQANSGELLMGGSSPLLLDANSQSLTLRYSGVPTRGWVVIGGTHLGGGDGSDDSYMTAPIVVGAGNVLVKNAINQVDTRAGSTTAKLPPSPNPGDWVTHVDLYATFTESNNFILTAATTGENFLGDTEEFSFRSANSSVTWVYSDDTGRGWVPITGTQLNGGSGTGPDAGPSGGHTPKPALIGINAVTEAGGSYPITPGASARLPESPTPGDEVHFVDLKGQLDLNNKFVLNAANSGENFLGDTDSIAYTDTRVSHIWFYSNDPAIGWIIKSGTHLGGGDGGGGSDGSQATINYISGVGNVAMPGDWMRVDARAGAVAVKMPDNPEIDDIVEFTDVFGAVSATNYLDVEIADSGEAILGQQDTVRFVVERQSVKFRFAGPEAGWIAATAIVSGSQFSPFASFASHNVSQPLVTGNSHALTAGAIELAASGAQSNFDGATIMYDWILPDGSTTTGPTISQTATGTVGTVLRYRVSARDSLGNASTTTVHTVTIAATAPPVMAGFVHTVPATVITATGFTATFSGATDPDGDDTQLTYEILAVKGVTVSKSTGIAANEAVTITPIAVTVDMEGSMTIRARDVGGTPGVTQTILFTVYASGFVNKPTPTLPAANSTNNNANTAFNGGTFTTTPPMGAIRTAMDVQVSETMDFTVLVAQERFNSISVGALTNPLPVGQSFYYRLRWVSNNYGTSEWSDPIQFSTQRPVNLTGAIAGTSWIGSTGAKTITTGIDHLNNPTVVHQKNLSTGAPVLLGNAVGQGQYWTLDPSSIVDANVEAYKAVTATGYGHGAANLGAVNINGSSYHSFTVAARAGVCDVVEYEGDGTGPRTIPHRLSGLPGFIEHYKLDGTSSLARWWHKAISPDRSGSLRGGAAVGIDPIIVGYNNDTFTVPGSANTFGERYLYVLYHEGGTGMNMVCGSYTGNGATSGPSIASLGFEPGSAIILNAFASHNPVYVSQVLGGATLMGDWYRPWSQEGGQNFGAGRGIQANASGFQVNTSSAEVNQNGNTYAFIAFKK